jgi:CHAD domain-containing protein
VARAERLARARVRAGRRAENMRAAIERASGMYLPDRLHEVRIAVKKLRYSLELVQELGRSRSSARIRTLKKLQDLLGQMHDLDTVITRIRALQSSANVPTLKMSADLDGLVRTLEKESRQLHARYVSSRRVLCAICDQTIARAANARARDAA